MKKYMLLSIAVMSLIFISGCASTNSAIKITGKNDALENRIEISTFEFERPFMGIINPSDHYFRGYIDKKTGEKTYQLYTVTNSQSWRYWDEIRFNNNGKLSKIRASVINSSVTCNSPICSHYEDVLVGLRPEIIKRWASQPEPFTIRYASSRTSETIDITINKAELLQFISKMEATNPANGQK